ncbi:MAG: hypothetical protein HWD61_08030 [Parachlamydiaceae bacterium]|nr:MAG: hypothetical protein HWD61_08030 [Parachlamydiaceae bacterium]
MKEELKVAAMNFKNLNRRHDPFLDYFLLFAYEGFEELKSDRTELWDVLGRLHNVVNGLASISKRNISEGIDSIINSLKGIKFSNSNWFKNAYMILNFVGYAKVSIGHLENLQRFYENLVLQAGNLLYVH